MIGYYAGYEVDWNLNKTKISYNEYYDSVKVEVVDAELAVHSLQQDLKTAEEYLDNAKDEETKAAEQLQELLNNPQTPEQETSSTRDGAVRGGAVKTVIRNTALFFVLGLFLSCGFVFLKMVFSAKLNNVHSVLTRYAFPVLGILPRNEKIWFRKTIRELEGEADLDYEAAGKATAQSLFSVVGDRKIALVSSEGPDLIQKLLPFVGERVPVCGDLLKDADAVKAAENYDGFVLVEKLGKSRFDMIDAEARRIESLGKQTEGIILL